MDEMYRRLREQARSHIGNAIKCGSELAREGAFKGEKDAHARRDTAMTR